MLKREYRLRDRRSVAKVYRTGRTARAGTLTVRYVVNNTDKTRLAVVVSKKVAKSAPVRNRIRRRVFESARQKLPQIKPGFDMIISVFDQNLKSQPQTELDELLDEVLNKAKLYV